MNIRLLVCALSVLTYSATSQAHDTWVQTNNNLVRTGDAVYVDLMLGNHGNEHRDFKLASKIDLESLTIGVIDPDGNQYDLLPDMVDRGYAPREGYWIGKSTTAQPGLYTVVHTLDKLHRTTRAVKTAKTFFVASGSLDEVSDDNPGFDRAVGKNLEFVLERNPVTPMGPGLPIAVRLLYNGKPLPNTRVSFIPRGVELAEGMDETYERTTDEEGRASFTPKDGNLYLVVAHHREPDQKGEGFDQTSYSATLSVFVPQVCPCCD